MREIKFRAWKKTTGEMFENIEDGYGLGDYFTDDRFEVMQYTGLKDKNGVEIYEGDICRSGYTDDNDDLLVCDNFNDFIYTVLYSEDHSGLNGYTQKDLEIIGNVYQNPELIE